jgi:hypothetical protein
MAKPKFTPITLGTEEAMKNASYQEENATQAFEQAQEDSEPMVPLSQVSEIVRQQVEQAMKNAERVPVIETPKPQVQYVEHRKEDLDVIPGLEDFEYKDRTYVLMSEKKPVSYSIRNRHKAKSPLQWTNPVTKTVHSLRFASNQPSFLADKQTGDVIIEHIIMKDGMLRVPKENVTLQKMLAIHPDNNKIWREFDPSVESKKVVEEEDILFEAQKLAREVDTIQLEAAARVLIPTYSEDWDLFTIKREVFAEAKRNPRKFIKIVSDPSLKIKGVIKTALLRGFISYSNYKFYDSEDNMIIEVSRNQDEITALSEYLSTNKGKDMYDYLLSCIN